MSAEVTTSCYSVGRAVNCATKYSSSIGGLIAIYTRDASSANTRRNPCLVSLSPVSLRTYLPINDWTTIRRRESYRSTTYPLSQVWYTCVREGWLSCICSGYASVCAVGRHNCVFHHGQSSSYDIDLVGVRRMSRNTLGWLMATA